MSLQQLNKNTPLNAPYSVPLTFFNVDSSSSNQVNKQVEIENRILRLIEFSNLTGQLRDETEMARKMIKSKVRIAFEDVYASLKRLEAKMQSQIETQLINRNIDTTLRTIEYDITQLLGKLTNMKVVDDRSHEFMMNQIDVSIRNVEKNYKIVENLKKLELDKFIDGSGGRQDVNMLVNDETDMIIKFLDGQNMNLNTRVRLRPVNSNESNDYREWLLRPSASNVNPEPKPLQNENRTGSFEFLDMEKELDLIDVIDDLDINNEHNSAQSTLKKTEQSQNGDENDGVTRIFNEILNKPTEYWLLKPANV